MGTDVVVKAALHPSAVPLGILPVEILTELSTILSTHGRAVYQEHDAILETARPGTEPE